MCQPGRAVEASVGRTEFLRAQKFRSSNAGLDSAARPASLAGGHLHISGVTNVKLLVLIVKWHHINVHMQHKVEILYIELCLTYHGHKALLKHVLQISRLCFSADS